MTERVSRDKKILAAWPQRGVCWKVVRYEVSLSRLVPIGYEAHDYSRWDEWQWHMDRPPLFVKSMPGFHVFTSLDVALLVEERFDGFFGVQEFDYDGLLGVGHFDLEADTPAVVLLCDRIRPRSWVTLPGCAVAQPAEMAEAVTHG